MHSRLAGTHWISHSKPGHLRLATVSLRDRKTPENKKIWGGRGGGEKMNHTGRTGELKHQQKLDIVSNHVYHEITKNKFCVTAVEMRDNIRTTA